MKKDNNWFLQIEIDSLNSLIEIVDYSMFPTFRKWQEKHKNKDNISEYDQVSQCVLQSMISKAKTLQLASNGFSIRDIKTKIIDISSMASIMRNIYETAFMYHNIFIMTDNDYELKILFYLWQIRGFNNLTQLPDIPSKYISKKIDTENKIQDLKNAICNITEQIEITTKAKAEILHALKQDTTKIGGYIFKKNSNTITTFQRVSFDKSHYYFNDERYANLYNYLSIHSHPTYLGLLEFGQMYDGRSVYEHTQLILLMACICLSKFMFDFCEFVDGGKDLWKEYSDIISTINFFNQL